MKYLLIVMLVMLFVGCSSQEPKPIEKKVIKEIVIEKKSIDIHDYKNIPQDITFFTNKIDNNISIFEIQKKYEKKYFSMWNIDKSREKLSSIKWPFSVYKVGNSYGANLQLIKQDFFDEMYENANFSHYGVLNKKAITLRHLNLRSFPTIKPLFRDPLQAGEGFPFDYLQNSLVEANKPIFISHYSKDKKWVYAFSSFASGWLKTSDIVFIDKKYTDLWQKAKQVFIIKDDIPIYSTEGNFLFNSKVGMMLALIKEDEKTFTVLTVSNYKNSKPLFLKSKISKDIAHKGILSLNKNNLNKIISAIFDTNYGWGGMYEQRDCSSTIRDMYAPFGIWLPRNSSKQAKVGKVISLKNLSNIEKVKLIKKEAIAFQTLLHKKGHIVLYVGTYNDEIIILHNTWGIKTKKDGVEGRIIIGKTILSTLKLGKNQKHYDKSAELLKNLKSMNILTWL